MTYRITIAIRSAIRLLHSHETPSEQLVQTDHLAATRAQERKVMGGLHASREK